VLALVGVGLWHAPVHAANHRVALVIQHSAGWPGSHLLWKCIEFAQEAIGGLALLELAGVNSGQPPQVYDWGGGADTVCQIDRQPTSVPDRCFGPTSGPNWSDWSSTSSGWVARSTGVNGYTLHDGDIEGWTYSSAFGAPPPTTRFAQVCGAPPSTVGSTHASAATTVRSAPTATAQPPPPTSTPAATSVEAVAPSATTSSQSVLASTGPPTQPPTPAAIGPWLLLGGATIVLLSLGVINLRRRGP